MTTVPRSSPTPPRAIRNGAHNGSRNGAPPTAPTVARCPVCAAPLPSTRARYCSAACRQRVFRLRHPSGTDGAAMRATDLTDLAALRHELQRHRILVAHTVYECPRCEARFVGERRCPECHVFCRALGLGGHCPDCDQPILLADLVPPAGKEATPTPPRT